VLGETPDECISTDEVLGDDMNMRMTAEDYVEYSSIESISRFYTEWIGPLVKPEKCYITLNIQGMVKMSRKLRELENQLRGLSRPFKEEIDSKMKVFTRAFERWPNGDVPACIDRFLPARTISSTAITRSYLGYKFKDNRFYRTTREWFARAVYIERTVKTLMHSASRLVGLLLVGGCNDEMFTKFVFYWFRRHPEVVGVKIPADRGIARIFRYVMRKREDCLKVPDIRRLDLVKARRFLWTGEDPWSDELMQTWQNGFDHIYPNGDWTSSLNTMKSFGEIFGC